MNGKKKGKINASSLECNPDEYQVIGEIEIIIKKPIKTFPLNQQFQFGYAIKNKHIIQLKLGNAGLLTIPESIYNLPFLELLNLKGNHLSKVSPMITNLIHLKYLDLSFNYLEFLPPDLSQLKDLVFLEVSHNKLNSLPETLGYLSQLRYLMLHQNPIKNVPSSLIQLKNLKLFYITHPNNDNSSSPFKNWIRELIENGAIIIGWPDVEKLIPVKSIDLIENLDGRESGFSNKLKTDSELSNALKSYQTAEIDRLLLRHAIGTHLDLAIAKGYMGIIFNSNDYDISLQAQRAQPLSGIQVEFWNEGNRGFIASPFVFPFAEAIEIILKFYRNGMPADNVEWVF